VCKIEDGVGNWTIPIGGLLEHAIDILFLTSGGHLPVEHEPLIHVPDVRLVDPEIDAKIDGGSDVLFDFLAFEFAYGLFEQLHVQLEPERVDVAALLSAQQVAGASYLEIEGRHAEAAPEIAELLDGSQSLLGNL